MSQLQTLVLLVLSLSPLVAETVLWKANGTINAGTGVFLRQDLPPDDPVTIRITYDDQAVPQVRGEIFGQVKTDYRTDLNLNIIITSGSYVWEGAVESATTLTPTTFLTTTELFPGPESAEINISSADNGSFDTFPFRLGDSAASFFLEFNGTDNSFLGSGISVADVSPQSLTSAIGRISTGVGNNLSFTIDPASLEVLFEADETVPPIAPTLSLSSSPSEAILSWPSDFRFRYRVESSPNLFSDTWTEIEIRFGTDATITRAYPITAGPIFYRVEALPRIPE